MAYNLSDYYNDTLSSSSASSSILDALASSNKFGSLSKITYSTGSTLIGYSETGNAIYDETVGAAYSEQLKQALSAMHSRNNDTMLKGPGYNTIENTSTGNVAVFKSAGSIVAMITEKGEFTGTVKLAQISDLDQLQLDTSKFYTKGDIQGLLAMKLSITDLFNDDARVKSDLLDVDIVRQTDLVAHTSSLVYHLTDAERLKWNSKYDKPATGIPYSDLAGDVRTTLDKSTNVDTFNTHKSDTTAHITSTERTAWNKKYLQPIGGIPMTDMTETVQAILNHAVLDATYNNHVSNDVKHITDTERANWNKKYDKSATGIPMGDLELYVQDILKKAVLTADFTAHSGNSVIHITDAERSKWNAKYDKPIGGIAKTDLASAVVSLLDGAATKVEFTSHSVDATKHITADERSKWNDHGSNASMHVSATDRSEWTAKYDKPSAGIPETDFTVELREKLAKTVYTTDFEQHITDSVAHVTAGERSTWNLKYDKPSTGVPEAHLDANFVAKVNAKADVSNFNTHVTDSIKHITDVERAAFNAKYNKPSAGIPEVDLAATVVAKLNGAATNDALNIHKADVISHVSDTERSTWNGKYAKPAGGVPYADLGDDVKTVLTNKADRLIAEGHYADAVAHVTGSERTAWNGKYVKPVAGIPVADLATEVTDVLLTAEEKVKVLAATEPKKIYKFVAATATSAISEYIAAGGTATVGVVLPTVAGLVVTIPASVHGVTKDAFDYEIQLYTEDQAFNAVTNVTKANDFAVTVNSTSLDITVTFAADFDGIVVVK